MLDAVIATHAHAHKAPPHNLEAEQALLGLLLTGNLRALEAVMDSLSPEHFFDPAHGRIYAACLEVTNRGGRPEVPLLARRFKDDPDLLDYGYDTGTEYLAALHSNAGLVSNAAEYAGTIRTMWLCRGILDTATEMADQVHAAGITSAPDEILEAAAAQLNALAERHEGRAVVSAADAVAEALQEIEAAARNGGKMTGITTGLTDLDRTLNGLKPGQLIILAARPSMGKSALAFSTIAMMAARAGDAVLGFSAEMTRAEVVKRWLAAETGITIERQDRGDLSAEDWRRLTEASGEIGALPLHIDDSDTLTPTRIRQRALRMQRKHKIKLIVVDHLQRLHADRRHRDSYAEVSEIVRELKSIAKALNVPVVLLSQLSRAVEQRDDKRPQLSDLRQSGRIEEEADVTMFLFREQYYLERAEPTRKANESAEALNNRVMEWVQRCEGVANVAEIHVAKNRGGRTGKVLAHFAAEKTLFTDLAR